MIFNDLSLLIAVLSETDTIANMNTFKCSQTDCIMVTFMGDFSDSVGILHNPQKTVQEL